MNNQWIYKKTKDNKARFLLGEKGERSLICVGINPSTAEPDNLDRTLATVKRFSSDLGYDSWMMLNIYPQRATNPDDLDLEINIVYHQKNLKYMESVLETGKCDVWAAWGTLITKRSYLFRCLSDFYTIALKYQVNWYTIGKLSQKGHPHHPLYLNKNLKMEKFDIDSYFNTAFV